MRAPAGATAEQWAQVRPVSAGLTEDLVALRAAGMRARVWSTWRTPTQPRPAFGLALAPAMVKLRKDGQDFAGTVARELSLAAAGNEYESAQVVLVSLADKPLGDCTVQASALRGPGGAVIDPVHKRHSFEQLFEHECSA